MQSTNRTRKKWNDGWRFLRGDATNAGSAAYDDSAWDAVCLPHTPKIETVDVVSHFQGICWYRKRFDAPPSAEKVYIEFEAAMQVAEVWVNGVKKFTHLGGYLPFALDVTDDLSQSGNVIALRLDNRDNPNVPPGKPLGELDFSYFGGLYRNAWIATCGRVHITDPVYANVQAGGGVFVTYENLSRQSAEVCVKTHVLNERNAPAEVRVITVIEDSDGVEVARHVCGAIRIASGEAHTFEERLTV
ncbi:MAG: hypothetical protein LBH54_02290 [Clostridiales bacterium]|jgi:beta-galactosidase|nr:hypothetical protein [Clostridiales bacterium]